MKPIILCIMDGWGISNEINHNAIKMGNTPVFDELLRKYPNGVMQASGADVGLPPGQMGNSEVGHMNLGAGRIVLQDLPRINNIIENGLLADNLALNNLIKEAKSSKLRTRAYVSVAWECPYEGKVDSKIVLDIAKQMLASGADEIESLLCCCSAPDRCFTLIKITSFQHSQ